MIGIHAGFLEVITGATFASSCSYRQRFAGLLPDAMYSRTSWGSPLLVARRGGLREAVRARKLS